MKKAESILYAIRNTKVGENIILHNSDMTIWCILKVTCKEHPEDLKDVDGDFSEK